MKTKIGVLLVLAVLLGACNGTTPAPAVAPTAGPDLAATVAALEAALTEIPVGVGVPVVVLATPEPPAPVVEPTATPEYRVVACGQRPPNGTLIQMLSPMTSRACAQHRCHNQGQVVPGSVRPLESLEADADNYGNYWLRFTYLPIQGKDYNLLVWEKKDGDWQWSLEWQFVSGREGEDFQCVEAWYG
jgi:hypothetical protein